MRRFSRREFMIGSSTVLGLGLIGCGPGRPSEGASANPSGALPALPKNPVTLSVLDVAGQQQLTKKIIDEYAQTHQQYVSDLGYQTATAPEMPGKIRAQQAAGQVSISLVLTGSDGLSSGIEQGIWQQLLPNYQQKFPNLAQNYIQPKAQDLAKGFGILDVFGNYGPTFTYDPQKLTTPPKTPDDLLQWAKANPNQLIHARPANSGPGRSLLQGLPYILGDSNPRDPDTWDRTWAYLTELGKYIQYYPSGTSAAMKELGQGARTAAASTMGWDMNIRVLGTVPKDFKAFLFSSQHLVADTQYICVPKGLDQGMLAVVLDLIAFVLKPAQQAKTYDNAFFYPGPAVKGATLDMAPSDSQTAVRSVLRPEFDAMIKSATIEMPLDSTNLVKAFDMWDKRVGANKLK